MNLVDTSGWIEFFYGGPNSEKFSSPIVSITDLIIPTICLYEVCKKITVDKDQKHALDAVAYMKQALIIDLNEDIVLKAALLSISKKIPMADSMILATAQMFKAVIWTQDKHFADFANVKYFETKK